MSNETHIYQKRTTKETYTHQFPPPQQQLLYWQLRALFGYIELRYGKYVKRDLHISKSTYKTDLYPSVSSSATAAAVLAAARSFLATSR